MVMLKCSKEAFAACPDRKGCGCPEEAVFTEGSECDMFNRHIAQDTNVLTNADRIRAMSDEELADWISRTQVSNVAEAFEVIGYVWKQPDNLKDGVKKECLEWLRESAEVSGDA